MQIRIIKNISDFKVIKADWDNLYFLTNCTVFQSFELNYYAWKDELSAENKNSLSVVIVKNNNGECAIFPFYIDAKKCLRFINDIHFDFCDFLSNFKLDLEVVFDAIRKEFSFSLIQLINLKPDSNSCISFEKKQQSLIFLEPFEKYSIVALEKGIFPENYPLFKSKQKTEFRRVKKKNDDKTHTILRADKDSFPKDEILSLKQKMIDLGWRDNRLLPEKQLFFIESIYNSNKLFLSFVKSQNSVNAISFILHKNNEYLFWIDMFDGSKMVSIFNYISLMQRLSAKNRVLMNLGRGAYDYKITNFKPEIKQLFAVSLFSNKWEKIKFFFFEKAKNRLKRIYKKLKK